MENFQNNESNWNLIFVAFLIAILMPIMLIIRNIRIDKRTEPKPFCGSISYKPKITNDTINYEIGKQSFKIYCASCHHINMHRGLIGPALKGTLNRFNNDTLRLVRYIRNSELYLKTEKDERMLLLHAEYNKIVKPVYETMSTNEIKSIIEYIVESN